MRQMLSTDDGLIEETGESVQVNIAMRILVAAAVIFIVGVVVALLGRLGYLPVDPVQVIGMTMLTASVFLCCGSLGMAGGILKRMPEYQEMEDEFREALDLYENEEWEEAFSRFSKMASPRMDHRRALYYGARCLEKMGRWEEVKRYIKRYLEFQPDDREAWELLATAHKRLFEYEEAEEAEERAKKATSRGH